MSEAPKYKSGCVELKGVSAQLKSSEVLKQVSVSVRPGNFTCLVGPNGAGKTSLLRAALGLLPTTEGMVSIDGQDMAGISYQERARKIAYMAQGAPVHWPLSVHTVVELGRVPHHHAWSRLSDKDANAVDAAMAAVRVTELKDRLVTKLSGGEKARVMLARALAVGAPTLFCDEPVASLDPRYQLEIMDVLAVQARAGKAVVAVMHDLALAHRYADCVVVMDAGEVLAVGSPADVLTDQCLGDVFGVAPLRGEDGALLNLISAGPQRHGA